MVCNPIIRCIIFTFFYVRNLKCSVFRFSFVEILITISFISLFFSFSLIQCNALRCNECDWLHRQLISSEKNVKPTQNDDVKLTCKYESENAKISIVTTAQLLEMNYAWLACVCVCECLIESEMYYEKVL